MYMHFRKDNLSTYSTVLRYISETLEFIPSDATDLDNDDLEYDFMEDSADEVVSSSESQIGQTLRTNKLSRVLASLRGRPN